VYKGVSKFICIPCDYITRDKYIYDRHIKTRKHFKIINDNEKEEIVAKYKIEILFLFKVIDKSYTAKQS